jgi:hypothetical protein
VILRLEKILQFFSPERGHFTTSCEALQSKTARSRVGGAAQTVFQFWN